MKPIAVSSLPLRTLTSKRTGEAYSSVRSLSEAFQLKDLLIHQETLPPGHAASAAHYHTVKEELIYLLQGTLVAYLGEERVLMQAGDSLGLPPSPVPHRLVNESSETAVFLSIGTCPVQDQTHFVP